MHRRRWYLTIRIDGWKLPATSPRTPTPPLLGELGLLADETRGRMLACLDGVELSVVELCDSLALPQSTVSRHLKLLADAGWVAARRDGTSRCYALTVDQLDEPLAPTLGARAREPRGVRRRSGSTGAGASRC